MKSWRFLAVVKVSVVMQKWKLFWSFIKKT